MEQTLVIIKPNVFLDKKIGEVISILERNDFTIKEMKMETFTREKAAEFYEIHRGKEFFERLLNFMVSGPSVEILLEGDDCVLRMRALAGATNPAEAAPGTIRRMFAWNVTENAIHASDSNENAAREIAFIFGKEKIGKHV